MSTTDPQARVAWVDVVKAIAICLVVLVHTDLVLRVVGIQSEPWTKIDAAMQPARMPLFFVASGLFATKWLHAPWSQLARKKLATLAYLYLLWSLLLAGLIVVLPLEGSQLGDIQGWRDVLERAWHPWISLWFLYALVLYFAVARVTHRVQPVGLLVPAAGLSILLLDVLDLPDTPWVKIGANAVFFLLGLRWRHVVVAMTERIQPRHVLVLAPAFILVAPPVGSKLGLTAVYGTSLLASGLALACVLSLAFKLASTGPGRHLARLGTLTLPVYLLHVPLLLLGLAALKGRTAWMQGAGLLAAPVVLTVVVILASLTVHALTRRAPWLYDLPSRRGRQRGALRGPERAASSALLVHERDESEPASRRAT